MIVETGRAVGTEGLVAGQVVDIKSEGKQRTVRVRRLDGAAQS